MNTPPNDDRPLLDYAPPDPETEGPVTAGQWVESVVAVGVVFFAVMAVVVLVAVFVGIVVLRC